MHSAHTHVRTRVHQQQMKRCRRCFLPAFVYINTDAHYKGLFVTVRMRGWHTSVRVNCRQCGLHWWCSVFVRACVCVGGGSLFWLFICTNQPPQPPSPPPPTLLPPRLWLGPPRLHQGPQSPSCHSAACLIENNQASDGTITLTL